MTTAPRNDLARCLNGNKKITCSSGYELFAQAAKKIHTNKNTYGNKEKIEC